MISTLFFFNHSIMCFILNIYSYDYQNILKYLKDTKVNLNNILIITEDFNIRDNNWDPLYSYYLFYTDILWEVIDSFGLELSIPINLVLICYIDNPQESNSILNLMFLRIRLEEFNNYIISSKLWSSLDYTSLSVFITLEKEFIQEKKQ